MYTACKTPCNECPFRKNSHPGYLGGVYENGQELHDMIMTLEKPFNCHKTIDKDVVSYDEVGSKEYPICAGALMYMKKNAKRPKDKEMDNLVQDVDKSQLDNILSVPELIQHHKNSIGFISHDFGNRESGSQDENHIAHIVNYKDLSNGKRTHEEVQNFIEILKKEREEIREFSIFGDNNWLRIDTMIDILMDDISDEEELYDLNLDEMMESECFQIFQWLDGQSIDYEWG